MQASQKYKRPEVMRTNCINQGLTALLGVGFFAEKVVYVWNDLPSTINFASLASFKCTIRDVDFSRYMLLICAVLF